MAFKRMDQVKADKGYEGPAVVCAVYFSPVAGHIPDRATIKYLVDQRDIEVWLVPIAGTRLVVPFRVAIPTPLGLGVLQATQFVSVPGPQTRRAVRRPSDRRSRTAAHPLCTDYQQDAAEPDLTLRAMTWRARVNDLPQQ